MDDINLLPLKDVAKTLKVSRVTLWRWINEKRIKAIRLSQRKVYIERKELERFVYRNDKGVENE